MDLNQTSLPHLPVIVIHGSLRSTRSVAPLCRFLRQSGLDARPFGYRTREESLSDNAEYLASFIEREFITPPLKIGFVTHSYGGLILRKYLAVDRRPRQSRYVFMIAPPNRGATLAAKLADLRAFQWMYGKTADELLPEVAGKVPWFAEGTEVQIVAGGRSCGRGFGWWLEGSHDGLVTLDETRAPLGRGPDPVVVGGLHGFLPYRPKVWRMAADFLNASALEDRDGE